MQIMEKNDELAKDLKAENKEFRDEIKEQFGGVLQRLDATNSVTAAAVQASATAVQASAEAAQLSIQLTGWVGLAAVVVLLLKGWQQPPGNS